MSMQRREHSGAFRPSELVLFSNVLDRLNAQKLDELDRQTMAQRVVANYIAGIRNEDELVEASRP